MIHLRLFLFLFRWNYDPCYPKTPTIVSSQGSIQCQRTSTVRPPSKCATESPPRLSSSSVRRRPLPLTDSTTTKIVALVAPKSEKNRQIVESIFLLHRHPLHSIPRSRDALQQPPPWRSMAWCPCLGTQRCLYRRRLKNNFKTKKLKMILSTGGLMV